MSTVPNPIPYRDPIAFRARKLRDPEENKVTPAWIKWFNYVNTGIQTALSATSDPFSFDFSAEDFWNNAGGPGTGTWDVIDAEAGHPGIQLLVTDVNNGDFTSSWTPTAADGGVLRWDQISTSRWVFKTPPDMTSVVFEAGLSSDARANWPTATPEYASDMIYLHRDTSTDNSLRFKVKVGGVVIKSVVLSATPAANLWIDVTFQRRLSGNQYVLDASYTEGPLITTVTSGLFSNSTAFGGMFRVGNRSAASRQLPIDLSLTPFPVIGKRWTVLP